MSDGGSPQPAEPRPWLAEREIDAQQARALLAEHFPQLHPITLEPFGTGWDNIAFLVNRRWVFRFPRRAIAEPAMRTELALLPMLAGRLPLSVPVPTLVGGPSASYPWPFAGYARLPGTTACRARLDKRQRSALAAPLAQFLTCLHTWDSGEARRHGAGQDRMRRWDLLLRRRQIEDRLARLAALGILCDARPWQGILDALPASYQPSNEQLVHGDLYARHLLVDAHGSVTAVIDWGDCHLGDPATDLAIVWGFLPGCAHADFFEIYGEIDPLRRRLARFRAYYYAVVLLLYGHDVQDAALISEGRASLELLRT